MRSAVTGSPLKPLRVGIDAHAIGTRLGGNESYIMSVIEGLKEHPQHAYFVYVTDDEAGSRVRLVSPAAHVRSIGGRSRMRRLGWALTRACRADRVDVLHVQYVAPIVSPPIVAMIHDLSYYHHPEWFSTREALRLRMTVPWTARRSARILTGSEYCRRDIMSTYGVPPEKISVSYHRVRSIFIPRETEVGSILDRLKVRQPYILAVGNLQPRKNLLRLIQAWQQLRRRHSDFAAQLVIVGRKAWMYEDILAGAAEEARRGNLVLTDYIPEADLPALYSGAMAFVYPSLFEGFGLPPLEAMACGAPVVVSRVTSLPEVCGEAALYIDHPEEVEAVAAKIMEMCASPELRRTCRQKGLAQAEKFRCSNLMEATVRAYESAAGAGGR